MNVIDVLQRILGDKQVMIIGEAIDLHDTPQQILIQHSKLISHRKVRWIEILQDELKIHLEPLDDF